MPKQLEENIRIAYVGAVQGTAPPDELVISVRALVRELKNEGMPPESVIVIVKDLCGLTHMAVAADTDSSGDFSKSREISDLVVSAVIDEYYKGAKPSERRPWQGYAAEIGEGLR
jgi:hypothetical protein